MHKFWRLVVGSLSLDLDDGQTRLLQCEVLSGGLGSKRISRIVGPQ